MPYPASLSPLALQILEAADNASGRFETEGQFFETFTQNVVPRVDQRESGVIATAIAEIVNAGVWPWGAT